MLGKTCQRCGITYLSLLARKWRGPVVFMGNVVRLACNAILGWMFPKEKKTPYVGLVW